jgi:limonene-1,2-epoxide hydrolase
MLSVSFFICLAPSPTDIEAVKNIIVAFQEDFNYGGFNNAQSYTTEDWVHVNPGGGITNGREQVLNEVELFINCYNKGFH